MQHMQARRKFFQKKSASNFLDQKRPSRYMSKYYTGTSLHVRNKIVQSRSVVNYNL